jgi:replicative DNA helicase
VREVFNVRLASGHVVTATANHPLLTVSGWRPVGDLAVGDHVAVAREVPEPGRRADELARRLAHVRPNPNVDVIPAEAWDFVRKAMREHGVTTRELARQLSMSYCGGALYKSGLSRQRMSRVADIVAEPFLRQLADSDVSWDRVIAIDPAGVEEVYDATVPGSHSFLADSVISHNSGAIEQDADMVVLLHREDFYERESPRAGEADLIVAKNRNGPTRTVTVAFQGHYSRFVDMSPA